MKNLHRGNYNKSLHQRLKKLRLSGEFAVEIDAAWSLRDVMADHANEQRHVSYVKRWQEYHGILNYDF